jgi:NhaP-type Na+/H+ or K+/H+ antiporter
MSQAWQVERRRRWLFRYALLILVLTLATIAAVLAGAQHLGQYLGWVTAAVAGCYVLWLVLQPRRS